MVSKRASGKAKDAENWGDLVGPPVVDVPASTDTAKEDSPPAGRSPDVIQHQTAEDMAANRGLREKYADKAHKLATGCIGMWIIFLGSQGIVKAVMGVEMWTEKAVIAVTAGVTINVLAAFLGVIRGLFPSAEKKTSRAG